MTTPIVDFLSHYIDSGAARLHMPGHKGNAAFPYAECAGALAGLFPWDITEISGADALYEADGIIGESERNAAALYGSHTTCYSAGGSTLCIQAMLALACSPGDVVVAARNAHHSFLNACSLLDLRPHWILPDYNDSFGVSGMISPETVRLGLAEAPDAVAVYITSPDYLGCISDVAGIAAVCQRAGKPLLVDNAHGAHLRFLPSGGHPMQLGASLCCDSAHKTLPVLTGGAYLHVSGEFAPKLEKEGVLCRQIVKEAMALFGSTSPSYLILLSLDMCNRYLAERGRNDFAALQQRSAALLQLAADRGFSPLSGPGDPTKLTLDGGSIGWSGTELAEHFRGFGVECEYAGERHMVLMGSPQNTTKDWDRVERALQEILPHASRMKEAVPFRLPEQVMSPRQARFSAREACPVGLAEGRVAAESRIQCPPGVPVIAAGERIGQATQKLLKRSGISNIFVVK